MPKSQLRAVADVAIFQCVIYDSKSRKRNIVVYACGTDVFWANDHFGLFDRDRVNKAPTWLKDQIKQLSGDVVRLDFCGIQKAGLTDAMGATAVELETTPVFHAPEGEGLGDEGDIKQAGG